MLISYIKEKPPVGRPKEHRTLRLRLSTGFTSPIATPVCLGSETSAVPADHRLRLENFQCVQYSRSHTIERGKHKAVNVTERQPGATLRCHCRHPNLVRAAPPLRPDMIFGKDTAWAEWVAWITDCAIDH